MTEPIEPAPPTRFQALWTWIARQWREGRSPALWILGLLIGVAAGYAVLGFILAIEAISYLTFGAHREQLASGVAALPAWHILLVPVGGGVVVGALLWLGKLRGWLPETRSHAVADVIEARAVRAGQIDIRTGLLSAVISAVTLGAGGSAGREGPAVHLGGALASIVAQGLGLPARAARIILACGAAAAVAASFNAPIAGAVFALEVVLGHYALRSIAPVAISSVMGALVARLSFGASPAFSVPPVAAASLWDFIGVVLLGFAAAGVAILFMRLTLAAPARIAKIAERVRLPLWALPPFGGLLVGTIALAFPEVLGVGYETTADALAGGYALQALIVLLVLKILATVITLGFRFGGGVFSPSLYLGAVLGAAFGGVAGMAMGAETGGTTFYALVGMGAVSGAVLGAPISTTLIVFELTASYEASLGVLIAVSLATLLTQSVTGGSFFQLQIQRKGYDLSRGQARVLLQTIRVRAVMTPLDEGEAATDAGDEAACLYEDDYLGRAIGFLSAEKVDGAAVRSRSGNGRIIGYLSKADAHAAYARALADVHEEEHR
ncbi:chloride channel protein [Hyphobacterium marinum]|uniref:Chloride channel protein n=1 Tax=Hyphobacterium marinum TaxID=3116574 RepID=A0ABU7LZF6_9PROT|nr:chloride channel protein [Hyphobacterium sp. Y6023]MEE2566944.1 chloride channel protein [Hyphobacterium sp. Y6023]